MSKNRFLFRTSFNINIVAFIVQTFLKFVVRPTSFYLRGIINFALLHAISATRSFHQLVNS